MKGSRSAPHNRSQPSASSSSSSVPFTVFISHAGEDKATIAIPLRKRLRKRGISAFVDETDMAVGTEARLAMQRAMEMAKIGVIVLSPEFVVKEWPMKELLCFLKRREEYSGEGNGLVTIPMMVPFFYRLSIEELYHEPKLDRRDRDGLLLHEKSRFYERQQRGEPEANIGEIKRALEKLHGIVGVRNDVRADNDSSYPMSKKRKQVLDELCNAICKVESDMMKMETSRENGQRRESDLHRADKARFAPKEKGDASESKGEKPDAMEADKLHCCYVEGRKVDAIYNLALQRENGGDGVERDAVEAKRLYRYAIEKGHVKAMSSLARLLTIGARGVERNEVEAKRLYWRAIEGGDVNAMCGLAVMLECGAEGVKRDAVTAEKLYRRAVDSGDVHAMYNLAKMLQNGAVGVPANPGTAEQLYRQAIEAGDVDAMYNLARMLTKGAEGVERDVVEAEELYRCAIENEHINAMYNLAKMLEKREEDVERDSVEAKNLYHRAIQLGHVEARFNLARMLDFGAEGVERNAVEAKNLYRRAIDDGHVGATYNLAVMLTNGAEGVEPDAAEAERLLKLYRRAIDAQDRG